MASSYPRDLVIFYGEGLYEQPDLGWGELASGGIATYAVPGENTNNRDAMREPNVEFVSDRIREYLGQAEPDRDGQLARAIGVA
jgi:hypothetical protein